MNYSTIKKTVALSLASAFAVAANAQDSTMTATTSSAKMFGGSKQYRTWTVGVNVGAAFPSLIIGGRNDFGANFTKLSDNTPGLYYGLSVRKQLTNLIGAQFNAYRGSVTSYNKNEGVRISKYSNELISTAKTEVAYDINLSGVVTILTFDFLKRESNAKIYGTAGYGLMGYNPVLYSTYANGDGTPAFDGKGKWGKDKNNDYIRQMYIPVGVGAKFKVSNTIAIDLGYDAKFIDADNFDGYNKSNNSDRVGVVHAGLEFSLGSKSKPDLFWSNPIAMMYDELKDPSLRQEVEALKSRVSNVEQGLTDLKKDSDGDGVADQFDKCANTDAGAKVDGSGCELDTDGDGVPDYKDLCPTEKGTVELNGCPSSVGPVVGSNIQFEYNSSVLKTSSYATLDKVASDLKVAGAKLTLAGHASAEGTPEYNQQLSVDRANAVKTYLVNAGVDAKKLTAVGYGESRPIASNTTEEGRMKNRRVELKK